MVVNNNSYHLNVCVGKENFKSLKWDQVWIKTIPVNTLVSNVQQWINISSEYIILLVNLINKIAEMAIMNIIQPFWHRFVKGTFLFVLKIVELHEYVANGFKAKQS